MKNFLLVDGCSKLPIEKKVLSKITSEELEGGLII